MCLGQPRPPEGVEADLDRVLHTSRTSPCAAGSWNSFISSRKNSEPQASTDSHTKERQIFKQHEIGWLCEVQIPLPELHTRLSDIYALSLLTEKSGNINTIKWICKTQFSLPTSSCLSQCSCPEWLPGMEAHWHTTAHVHTLPFRREGHMQAAMGSALSPSQLPGCLQ